MLYVPLDGKRELMTTYMSQPDLVYRSFPRHDTYASNSMSNLRAISCSSNTFLPTALMRGGVIISAESRNTMVAFVKRCCSGAEGV